MRVCRAGVLLLKKLLELQLQVVDLDVPADVATILCERPVLGDSGQQQEIGR